MLHVYRHHLPQDSACGGSQVLCKRAICKLVTACSIFQACRSEKCGACWLGRGTKHKGRLCLRLCTSLGATVLGLPSASASLHRSNLSLAQSTQVAWTLLLHTGILILPAEHAEPGLIACQVTLRRQSRCQASGSSICPRIQSGYYEVDWLPGHLT